MTKDQLYYFLLGVVTMAEQADWEISTLWMTTDLSEAYDLNPEDVEEVLERLEADGKAQQRLDFFSLISGWEPIFHHTEEAAR